MKKILIAIIFILQSNHINGTGNTAANFLRIGVGARAIGLGEAYTGISDEVNAIYWNPAGLGKLQNKEISLMHSMWLENINHLHIAYVHPDKKLGILGVSINYLWMDPIRKIGIDRLGIVEGPVYTNETYSPYDLAFTVGYGNMLNEFSGGINIKFIHSRIEKESAYAFAIDMGAMYELNPHITLGLVTKNIGTPMKFRNKNYGLPFEIELGTCLRLLDEKLTIGIDLNKPIDNIFGVNLGMEYLYKPTQKIELLPRIGYRSNIRGLAGLAGISCGIGFKWTDFIFAHDLTFDYAWTPFYELGNVHRISISMKFGKIP